MNHKLKFLGTRFNWYTCLEKIENCRSRAGRQHVALKLGVALDLGSIMMRCQAIKNHPI